MKPIGTRFGLLTIIEILVSKGHSRKVKCLCDCGRTIEVLYRYLVNGITKSCGHCDEKYYQRKLTRQKRSSLVGQTFGRLKVLEEIFDHPSKRIYKCLCSCGNIVYVEQGNLKSHLTTSCGCYRKEKNQKREITEIHEFIKTRLYRIWSGMKTRCYNVNNKDYKYYGQLGIIVCSEWKEDFMKFREWAIQNGYQENLSIDRINPYGNYEPSNCRWATAKEQANNKRKHS